MGDSKRFETNLGIELSMKEADFIKQYVSPNSGTYMNADKSSKAVGYKNADSLMRRERIKRALSRVLSDDLEIDEMIRVGVKQRLRDPDSKYWQETASFVCKLRGDYVEKATGESGLSDVEREARLLEVAALIHGDEILATGEGDVDEDLIEVGHGD